MPDERLDSMRREIGAPPESDAALHRGLPDDRTRPGGGGDRGRG